MLGVVVVAAGVVVAIGAGYIVSVAAAAVGADAAVVAAAGSVVAAAAGDAGVVGAGGAADGTGEGDYVGGRNDYAGCADYSVAVWLHLRPLPWPGQVRSMSPTTIGSDQLTRTTSAFVYQ